LGITLDPRDSDAHNNLADLLANYPEAKFHDPKQAIVEAKIAIDLNPRNGTAWSTLGEAYYRAGQWNEAIPALEKGLAMQKGVEGETFFHLAMAHRRLGHTDEARKCYNKGTAWMDKYAPKDLSLKRYRSEAEKVIGKN
jgi:uncharacterized protein HemY